MSSPEGAGPASSSGNTRAANVIVVNSVMFKFISYWRTAAVVLCDLASTAYYIGGIVEQSIGAAAPWFILAVMMFSYAVRSVYIESCSLFVRGGVYRVVKEAMGGWLAKLSVSALMFDYILTGPISGVSAGQYIMGLGIDLFVYAEHYLFGHSGFAVAKEARDSITNGGAVVIACGATLYFFRENIKGIHESSDKAVKIMKATTVMAVVILVWCGATLASNAWERRDLIGQPGTTFTDLVAAKSKDGKTNHVPMLPDLRPHPNFSTDPPKEESPLGYLENTGVDERLRELSAPSTPKRDWLSLVGLLGIAVAFGHSILAMSGEETLAQVYREVEAPKMLNFKKAAFVVFVYSMVLTAGISFLAVLLIPDDQRMSLYRDNLIGGLAMNVIGPNWALLALQAFVVFIGFLILSGAVNTAIIGSNGVLNRVAEDGVMPDWFLKPHRKYGTTYRILALVVIFQLFTIVASRGDTLVLGEAYAFGVVWSFVFKALAMVVLRFKQHTHRDYKVPLNVRIGKLEIPVGLILIFLVLAAAAITNLLTKETATTWGLGFTAGFLMIFVVSEKAHERRLKGAHHDHQEQFNQATADEISREKLRIDKPFVKLVAIRSPQNLFMLEKALLESDPKTTSVVVMTAKFEPGVGTERVPQDLDKYDTKLMTAVVDRAEKSGKEVIPLIVPTNNPLFAVINTAKALGAQELVIGVSNKNTADEQLDQVALYWFNVNADVPRPLTVRIVSRDREVHLDLAGGNRIPKISERQARNVAELRAAGVGVSRVLLVYNGSAASHDLFQSVLTMLDPKVDLDLIVAPDKQASIDEIQQALGFDRKRASQLGREMNVLTIGGDTAPEIVRCAREGQYNLIIASMPTRWADDTGNPTAPWLDYLLEHAHCPVFLASPPAIPTEVDDAEAAPK